MTGYEEELNGLAGNYSRARTADLGDALERAAEVVNAGPVLLVASGGASAVAEIAATLHVQATGTAATTATPLRAIELMAAGLRTAVVVFSSRARHPDTEAVVRRALRAQLHVVLVTERHRVELLGALADDAVVVLSAPPAVPPDGFLATGSVVTMAVMAFRLYHVDLPEAMPAALCIPDLGDLRTRLLVLHGLDGRAAAVDIETRLHELGFADVQTADYRNVAHGRHVGLMRRGDSTTVIALESPAVADLAARTQRTLDPNDLRRVSTDLEAPLAQLALLTTAMHVVSEYGRRFEVEPSKPKVTHNGRRLYHLPIQRSLPLPRFGPVEQKLAAGGWTTRNQPASTLYARAYVDWMQRVSTTAVAALVLDYDGTCVTTGGRYDLPEEAVQRALINVLNGATPVVFATGRGSSLYKDLREWVPKRHWALIGLGLHNGAWRQELAADLTEPVSRPADWLTSLAEDLAPFVDAGLLSLRTTSDQLTLRNQPGTGLDHVWRVAQSIVQHHARVPLRVARSGHSVDVVAAASGKDAVLLDVQGRFGNVLAIGDQGALDGNDFQLLAGTELSVSVGTCSADPTRCWPIASYGVEGPAALVFVLSRLQQRRGRLYLDPPAVKDGAQ